MIPSATADRAAAQPSRPTAYARLRQNTALRVTLLFLYYLGVIAGLLLIYGRGDFVAAPFVYQGF